MLRLELDTNFITIDDIITLEEPGVKMKFMRDLIARFVVDEMGNKLPAEEAKKVVGKLNMPELRQVTFQLKEKLESLQAEAVPLNSSGH